MFTGIVEEIGVVKSIKSGEKSSKITIGASKVLKGSLLGDSISTNGICLTVCKIGENYFEVDIMFESLKRSNLGDLKVGDKVNLERALTIESRLGGHIVSGHIDGVGKILLIQKEENSVLITVKAPPEILKYIVEKGSITIDGVSLTVISVNRETFKVGIIPHTLSETIILNKKQGDKVNLECDVIGKYVEKLLFGKTHKVKDSKISESFLKENGFI